MTPAELTKAMQDREVLLADVRKAREEYLKLKAANATPSAFGTPQTPAMSTVAPGGFNF